MIDHRPPDLRTRLLDARLERDRLLNQADAVDCRRVLGDPWAQDRATAVRSALYLQADAWDAYIARVSEAVTDRVMPDAVSFVGSLA